MKRFIAIFIAVMVMAGTIHMDELAKLPLLINHYKEHKTRNPSATLLNFLYLHYAANPQSDSAGEQGSHSKLPFKSEKQAPSHFGLFVQDFSSACLTCSQAVQLIFPDTGIKSSSGYTAIWQPPKLV